MTKLNQEIKKEISAGFWGEMIIGLTIINVIVGVVTGIANIVTNATELSEVQNLPLSPVKSTYIPGNIKPKHVVY